jgi:exopolysaccharide biosynthesis polyprenyl glycosylphosphotransferase
MAHASPRRRSESRFVALLVVSDLLVCSVAVILAYLWRWYWSPAFLSPLAHEFTVYLRALPFVLLIWLAVFAAMGMYEPQRTLSPIAARGADFRAASMAFLMIAAASFLSHVNYSRLIVIESWLLALPLTWVTRALWGRVRRVALTRPENVSRTLIVGCGDLGRIVLGRLRQFPFGLQPVGFIATDDAPGEVDGLPVLGQLGDLPGVLAREAADEVLVADPGVPAGQLMEVIRASEANHTEFLVVAGPLQVLTAQAELSGPADLPVLELRNRAFGPVQRLAKRVCDLLGALLLLVLVGPLMLAISPLIRRRMGAPVLFRQVRVGYRGREFTMLKFRTMHADAEAYAVSPQHAADGRVTPLGRWLRKYSLDELPQLLNVLRGDMSLVGPRPEMPFLVAQYEPWQRRRLDAVPGITGLWQILGRKDLPLRDNIEYDFYYIRNQSLLLDLAIFLRTIPIVIFGKGAY